MMGIRVTLKSGATLPDFTCEGFEITKNKTRDN